MEIISAGKAPPNRVLNAICATQWAMAEDDLRVIISIASRESELDPQAVQALLGRPMDNTRSVTVRNGVAIVPVIGPIFRYSSLFNSLSGAASLNDIAKDFNTALDSPSVNAILLEIDSPGGEANGIGEFADMIYEARMSQDKPIWAYVSNHGASAAYWIASAAEKMYIAPTAMVGSIGTVVALRKPDPKATTVEFVSSQSPNKRPNIGTEEGKATVQAIVDSLTDVFVSSVAKYRGVETETVLNDFGAGGVKIGNAAVKAGMVDGLSTFERCIAALAQPVPEPARQTRRLAAVAAPTTTALQADDIVLDGTKPIARRFLGMSLADRYNSLRAMILNLDASDEGETTQVDTIEAAVQSDPTPTPAVIPVQQSPATVKSGDNEEIAKLRAENRRLLVARYNAEAVAMVDAAITAGQVFPVERERVIAMFVQASLDDATLGATEAGESRIQMLTAAYSVRPQHQLTAENLAPSLAAILRGSQPTTASIGGQSERAPTADEVRKLLAQTALGTSVLKAIDSGDH